MAKRKKSKQRKGVGAAFGASAATAVGKVGPAALAEVGAVVKALKLDSPRKRRWSAFAVQTLLLGPLAAWGVGAQGTRGAFGAAALANWTTALVQSGAQELLEALPPGGEPGDEEDDDLEDDEGDLDAEGLFAEAA